MTTKDSARKCSATCWYVAVGLGLLLAVVLIAAAGWSFLWGGLLGVVVFLVLGFVLPQVVCTAGTARRPMAAGSSPANLVAGDPPASPRDTPAPPAPAAAAVTGAATGHVPDNKVQAEPAPEAHPVPEEATRPVPQDAPSAPTAPEETEKPETLDAPRGGTADDLKRIKGIGPKLEKMLNGMGVYHFDQIANWTEAEIAWVDRNLTGFKGRASRDEWTRQAVTLARGAN